MNKNGREKVPEKMQEAHYYAQVFCEYKLAMTLPLYEFEGAMRGENTER